VLSIGLSTYNYFHYYHYIIIIIIIIITIIRFIWQLIFWVSTMVWGLFIYLCCGLLGYGIVLVCSTVTNVRSTYQTTQSHARENRSYRKLGVLLFSGDRVLLHWLLKLLHCALRYGYKCKHLLLLFFEPIEAKFNLEQTTKAQRGSKCTALPVDLTNKVRACLFWAQDTCS